MTTTSLWLTTLTNFTCSSALLKLTRLPVGQESPPSRVKLDISGIAFVFTIEQQEGNRETQDDSGKDQMQVRQVLQFNPPLSFPNGSYPVTIAFPLNNLTTFSEPSHLEPIDLSGCVTDTNVTENKVNEKPEPLATTDIETQSEITANPTATPTHSELVTSSWIAEPQATQNDTLDQNTKSDDDTSHGQVKGESNVSHTNILESTIPTVILFCLFGLIVFFIIRRYRNVKVKRGMTYYAFDNEFSAAEEGHT